jgi:hypothetical protein
VVMRAVQYVLLYEENERWPFPGPAEIADIQTGPAEGGEAPYGCLRLVPDVRIMDSSNLSDQLKMSTTLSCITPNVIHHRVDHTTEWITVKHIVNAISYSLIS